MKGKYFWVWGQRVHYVSESVYRMDGHRCHLGLRGQDPTGVRQWRLMMMSTVTATAGKYCKHDYGLWKALPTVIIVDGSRQVMLH